MSDVELQFDLDVEDCDLQPDTEEPETPEQDMEPVGGNMGQGRGKGRGRGSARGGSRRGAGRNPRKGERACAGCTKVMAHDLFPKGSDKCAGCKRGANCIYNSCVRQNELDWYYEQMNCPIKRRKLLVKYNTLFPAVEGVKAKPVNLLQLKQSVRTESAVDKNAYGEMMWIGHAVHHFQKPKNGGLDLEEIKAKFMAASLEEGAITDNDGPKKAPLRVWFKTKDSLAFRESFIKAKAYELTDKTTKKATQDDVDKALSWIQANHDNAGKASNMLDIGEVAKTWWSQATARMEKLAVEPGRVSRRVLPAMCAACSRTPLNASRRAELVMAAMRSRRARTKARTTRTLMARGKLGASRPAAGAKTKRH